MIRRALLCVVVAAASLLPGGCGAVANTCWFNQDEGGMRVYGGVRGDWEVICESFAAASHPEKNSPNPVWLPIVDMPLSAALDTLTLPLTIPISLWEASNPRPHEWAHKSGAQPRDGEIVDGSSAR